MRFKAQSAAVCAAIVLCLVAAASTLMPPSFALGNGGSITSFGVPLAENFDSLAATGTGLAWTDNSTIPGWYSTRTTYNSGTGSSNTGALYSFGVTGTNPATDRALGSVASTGTGTVYQAVRLTNNTGGTITSLDISYAGEQWRNGGNTTAHTLTFQYQVANAGGIAGANSPATGWTTFAPLSFTGPIALASAAALDGNAPANRILKSATLSVTANAGQEIWLRWQDPDDAGNDHGLAIDDFSVAANGAVVESAPSVITTIPANSASNVPVTSTVVINFSESVTAASDAFAIECPAGSPQAFTQSASPASTFTLTPAAPLPSGSTCNVTVAAAGITDTDVSDPPDSMAADVSFSFTTANPAPPGAVGVIINEIDADTPGSDNAEFVELYDGGVGHTSLAGLVVVFYNGGDHKSYAAFDLDGFATNASGYFTLGNPTVPGVDLVFDPGANGLLQNGADAVALYAGHASDFPNGTPVTLANLQDAVVYDTDDPDDAVLLTLLNDEQPQVNENGGGSGATQSSQRCPNGSGGARNTSSYSQAAPTPGAANSCTPPPPPANSPIVISQLYGGGGNSGATYQNDYVELFNRGTTTVDIAGWSLQYASATGSGWDFNKQPLGGTIKPGEDYLIALASGGATGAPVPPANISGLINMSGTAGKVALVDSFDGLVGNCPTADPHVMDLVGYGSTADCREGTKTAPSPSNTTAIFRLGNGSTDTNQNGNDFVTNVPNPRRTAPIVELGPLVLATDPRSSGVNAPRDATIQVTFTEPVDVIGAWFDLTCAASGQHDSATFAGTGRDHYITPNVNFIAGEQCTVTIFAGQVHDQDLDDAGPNTDTLPADFSWSFRVASGTEPPFPPDVHLTIGNPSGAVASIANPDNYLMQKPEYAMSYNRDFGRPNWVSWHLSDEWVGTLTRVDTFRPDPAVPPDWYRVQAFDFAGSGFDRGHMTPKADRDKETSIPINQATFLMSNMVAQAPDNNQGPWAALESDLRALLPANELYIVAGGAGTGGTGSNGGVTTTLADGHVTVPAQTWKVALVVPKGDGDDVSRVTCATRTIAVVMPNTQGIRDTPWQNFLTSVDAVETLTGYDLFSNLPAPIQGCVEAGINGDNPRNAQAISFGPLDPRTFGDAAFTASALGGDSGNPVTFTASGACTAAGPNGATITLTSAGACTITAAQEGNVNYNAAPSVSQSFTIARAVAALTSLSVPVVEAGTPSATVSGVIAANGLVPPGTVTITAAGTTTSAPIAADGQFSASIPTAALAAAGSPYTIVFSYAGAPNFTAASAISTLQVVDTTAPALGAVTATPNVLATPNHKMIEASVAYTASDLSGAPSCSLSVSANEPVNGLGDGNTSVDWQVLDAHRVLLRAERSGLGSGRTYTITVRCADAFGNVSAAAASVAVPK